MARHNNPRITTDGLVLCLDAANQKSINIPSQSDHGYADWYCLATGTATYSIVNSSGGSIYENNAGGITTLVTATVPQRGTISITAGRIYYGSVPINLVVEDEQHSIAPLTMMGTQFWNIAVRNNPSTYYVYSPYQAATVNFYDATAGGLTGTPTSTLSLSAGQSGTFTSSNLTNHWISSTTPILATVTQTAADRTILSPMAQYVYQRYVAYYSTTNSTTPTTVGANVIYDSTYKVMSMSIGDGAGGDCAQSLGLEYLSDTYSWGNVLSDYGIAAPYAGTTVTTYYWSGTAWVVWDTHSLSGTITVPAYVARDGTLGPGVDATTISGVATNMASGATLWKWESNKPIYLCVNDSVDDEFSVLGWNKATATSPRSSNKWNDLSGNNNGTLVNGPTYNSGYIVFDGVNDSVTATISNFFTSFSEQITIETWIYVPSSATWNNANEGVIVGRGNYSGSHGLFRSLTNNQVKAYFRQSGATYGAVSASGTITRDAWYQCVAVWTGSSAQVFINGNLIQTSSGVLGLTTSNEAFVIGGNNTGGGATASYFTGNISNVKIYNRALSADEIQQNFNALRNRFGI